MHIHRHSFSHKVTDRDRHRLGQRQTWAEREKKKEHAESQRHKPKCMDSSVDHQACCSEDFKTVSTEPGKTQFSG